MGRSTPVSHSKKRIFKFDYLELNSARYAIGFSLITSFVVSLIVFFLWKWLELPDKPSPKLGGYIASPQGWRKFCVIALPLLCSIPTIVIFVCQIISPRTSSFWKKTLRRDIYANIIISLLWLTIPPVWHYFGAYASYTGLMFIFWLAMKGYVLLPWMLKSPSWNISNALCSVLILWSLLGGIATWGAQTSSYSDAVKYMLFTHSLVHHGTEDTTLTVKNREYRDFYWGRWHKEFIHSSPSDIKAPLAPYALYLPYALGGRLGVLLFYSLLLSASVVLTASFIFNYRIANIKSALIASLVGITSCPVIFLSHVEFPDIIGLFLFSLSLYICSTISFRYWKKLVLVFMVALLAYYIKNRLVIGFFALLTALAFDYAINMPGGKKTKCIAGSFVLLLAFSVIGVLINRSGLWGDYNATEIILSNLLGLFGGQNFGLFFVAPVFMLAFISLFESFRLNSSFFYICFFSIFLSLVLLIGLNWWAWHGGFSPPYRYLMYTLPAWAALLAFWVGAKDNWRRVIFWLFTASGAIYTTIGVVFPYLKTNRPVGASNLLLFIEKYTGLPFYKFFPSAFMHTGNTNLWCFAWVALSVFCLCLISYSDMKGDKNYKFPDTRKLSGITLIPIIALILVVLIHNKFTVIWESEMMTSDNTSIWSPTNPLHARGRVFFNGSTSERVVDIPKDGTYNLSAFYVAQLDGNLNVYLDENSIAKLQTKGTATPLTRKTHKKNQRNGFLRGRFKNRERTTMKDTQLKAGRYNLKVEYLGPDGRENWLLLDYLLLSKMD